MLYWFVLGFISLIAIVGIGMAFSIWRDIKKTRALLDKLKQLDKLNKELREQSPAGNLEEALLKYIENLPKKQKQ